MNFFMKPLEESCRDVFELSWDSILGHEEIKGVTAHAQSSPTLCVEARHVMGKTYLTLFNSRGFQVVHMKLVESQASLVPLCKLEERKRCRVGQMGQWAKTSVLQA